MKEILFKYVIDCKIKDKIERVFVLVDIEDLENSNDFNELLFNRADEAFKELIGHECHCINESQSFCDCGESIDDFEIVERLRYTGLKDKNDKIIFEGDIALFTNKNLSDIYEKQTVKIEYSKCSLWCAFESSKTALSLFVEDDKYEFEIIGNIYDKDAK